MKPKHKKILKTSGWCAVVLLALWYSLFLFDFTRQDGYSFGVSFASSHAEHLGLNSGETFLAILDDLKAKNIRLSVFWNRVEKNPQNYDFSELDWQMEQAQRRGAKVILAIGRRTPRWTECHEPDWVKKLPEEDQNQYLLGYLRAIVNRYKNAPALRMWQVENEAFLYLFTLKRCPYPDKKFFKKELALVEKLDPSHPIMVTDSGEFGSWLRTRHLADYLGISIYRVVAEWWSGYVKYGPFVPAAYYRVKAKLVGKPIDKIIVSELQVEPWTPQDILKTPFAEQYRSMGFEQFQKNIAFARKAGFKEIYLWGVEWWYYLKEIQNEPRFWQAAKVLMREN